MYFITSKNKLFIQLLQKIFSNDMNQNIGEMY